MPIFSAHLPSSISSTAQWPDLLRILRLGGRYAFDSPKNLPAIAVATSAPTMDFKKFVPYRRPQQRDLSPVIAIGQLCSKNRNFKLEAFDVDRLFRTCSPR